MATTLSWEERTARKEHCCSWCGEKILKGEKYKRWTGIYEGEFQSNPMHIECDNACFTYMKELGCDEYTPYMFKRGSTEER